MAIVKGQISILNNEPNEMRLSGLPIKPCPFCGANLDEFPDVMIVKPSTSDAYIRWKMEKKKIVGSDAWYNVRCVNCGATGARGMTEVEAVKRWNCRNEKYIDLSYHPKSEVTENEN